MVYNFRIGAHLLTATYLQVRTGSGARPPRRGDKVEGTDEAVGEEIKQVLKALKGPVGERKRKNIEDVRQRFTDALAQGGLSDLALKELVAFGSPSA